MKPTKTPNKDEYDTLCQAIGKQLNANLVLCNDATWHIVRVITEIDGCAEIRTPDIQEFWHGWEEMLRRTSRKQMETLHKLIWPNIELSKKRLGTNEALCVLIWNYRCSRAKDWTKPIVENSEGSPARNSAIGGRTYKITNPPAGAQQFTSKAGLACLKIIKDICGDIGICTEAQLKAEVLKRGEEITPTAKEDPSSAWRFLQFYRPKLEACGLLIYTK